MVNRHVPLTEKELEHLREVVTELERHTTGEIRLMIVRSSSAQGHLRYLLWFLYSTIALFGLWIERHLLIWTADWWLVPSVFLITFMLAWLTEGLPILARAFARSEDLNRQVWLRAEAEFHREGLGATRDRTGILLFISLLEHQAVVLADRGIAEKLEADVWREVVETLLQGPKTGLWAQYLETALKQCGALLAGHFPAGHVNKNELPNHVIIKE